MSENSLDYHGLLPYNFQSIHLWEDGHSSSWTLRPTSTQKKKKIWTSGACLREETLKIQKHTDKYILGNS